MPWLITIFTTTLIPALGGIFKGLGQLIIVTYNFVVFSGQKIIRWGIILIIFNLTLLILQYGLYHFYYGGAYVLSHFLTTTTLNIIHSSILGYIIYYIYNFLYGKND